MSDQEKLLERIAKASERTAASTRVCEWLFIAYIGAKIVIEFLTIRTP
jgi:hypothetical protein